MPSVKLNLPKIGPIWDNAAKSILLCMSSSSFYAALSPKAESEEGIPWTG